MNFLEEKIISDGVIKEGNILKVDNFLNHQIDIVKQAGADVVGLGVALEKGQQKAASFSARRDTIWSPSRLSTTWISRHRLFISEITDKLWSICLKNATTRSSLRSIF